MSKKITTDEFIHNFKTVFGDKYDFSKAKYINAKEKIEVFCHEIDEYGLEHGTFWATPSNLNNGFGCPKCAKVYRYNNTEFIDKAKLIHGNKYDYSLTNYVNSTTKVKIICHEKDDNGVEHGIFEQTPNKHLSHRGCPKCAIKQRGLSKRGTLENFISKAKLVHGERYDYSQTQYSGLHKSIDIICHNIDRFGNEHGLFKQLPSNHLNGKGCPLCNQSHLEELVENKLIEYNIGFIKQKKFQWLKKKNYLPLDFYLPEYNIAIECQGKQHYMPVNFGGKIPIQKQNELFKIQKNNDLFKKTKCEENGVDVYYISYNDDIEIKINELINKIK